MSPVPITSLSHGDQNAGRLAAEAMVQPLQGSSCSSQLVPWVLVEKESS